MSKTMTLNVRIGGELRDHVAGYVGEDGRYDNVSEYVRDLIRRDLRQVEAEAFEKLKAELQLGFATPDDQYVLVSAEDVIARNRRRRNK